MLMAKINVEVLIEGGKATAAPPLGPALGPTGVNIGQVVAEINKKTAEMKGMQVPVKVTINPATKEFSIEIGTPPAAALIKREAGVEKGASNPLTEKVADVLIEQIIKVAKMKEGSLLGKTLKQRVKEIVGTCQSMGILVEGKYPTETLKDIDAGVYDTEITQEKTELTAEELAKLEEEKKRLAEEIEKRRAEFEKIAKDIISQMAGKERGAIKAKLSEAGIPDAMIKELLPVEGAAAAAGAPGAAVKPGEKAAGAEAKPTAATAANPEAKKAEAKGK